MALTREELESVGWRIVPAPSAMAMAVARNGASFDEYRDSDSRYRDLAKRSEALSRKRSALPPGSSRARVTSANAHWARFAEARDRREDELRAEWEARSGPGEVAP
jgi:precorrin-6B methylase 1